MDVRGALRLSMCLLIAAAGCQHEVMTLPNSTPNSASPGNLEPGPIKKVSANPKDLPPTVLVSYGNFEAGEAFAERTGLDRQQQLCESARTDYERALSLDPSCVPAYQGLARLYTHMHDLPLAVETYQKALKLAPNDASLWFELGLCHNFQKNVGPALQCLERASQLDPGNHSYVNALGVVLAESGRYKESLKCFSRTGGEAMAYYRLSQTLHRLQKPELSQRCMAVAVQKDPSLAPPIQQASYQPIMEPEPKTPPPAAEPEAKSAPMQILLPPVPLINEEVEQPNP